MFAPFVELNTLQTNKFEVDRAASGVPAELGARSLETPLESVRTKVGEEKDGEINKTRNDGPPQGELKTVT